MTTITLTTDEALILFEFLTREIDDRKGSGLASVIDHPAEYWVLNSMQADLQRELIEPFKTDYRKLLNEARERRLDQSDPERTFVIGSA